MAILRLDDDHHHRSSSHQSYNDASGGGSSSVTNPNFAGPSSSTSCPAASTTFPCGACRCCDDTCGEPTCEDCYHCDDILHRNPDASFENETVKCCLASARDAAKTRPGYYTKCEIRRHSTMQSAWIVAGQDIYDVTEYMNIHPGGSTSLLKKSGGLVDCTRDLNFHSKRGQKLWQQYHVGKVIPCPSQANQSPHNNKPGNNMVAVGGDWWKFW